MDEQYYAVTAPHGTIYVTAYDADRVESALRSGATQIRIRDSMVALNAGVSVFRAEEYIAMQNEQLNARGRWMCKSGTVHEAESRCECGANTRKAKGPSMIQTLPKPEDTPKMQRPRSTKTLAQTAGPAHINLFIPDQRKTDENTTTSESQP